MNILTLNDVRETTPAAFSSSPHPRTSRRYSLFRTSDIIESLQEEGWEITRANQTPNRRTGYSDYSRHIVALSKPELTYKDEQIEALLINSNDGLHAFRFELGIYRFVCSNGLIDATANFSDMEIRHFGYTPEQVQKAGHRVVERAPEILAVLDAWKSRRITIDQQDQLAQYALGLRYPNVPAPIDPELLHTIRREEDFGGSLWSSFNRIQENVLKGGFAYVTPGGRQLTSRPLRSIRANISINKALWNAAEALYRNEDLVLPA
jgi:hypothetical protein